LDQSSKAIIPIQKPFHKKKLIEFFSQLDFCIERVQMKECKKEFLKEFGGQTTTSLNNVNPKPNEAPP
jgi:hypothetical protein